MTAEQSYEDAGDGLAHPFVKPFDVQKVRNDFPALHQTVHGKPLVYLDSAATSLKPSVVIDAVASVYGRDCANIHRGVHLLSARATERFEAVRTQVAEHIGASSRSEIVFTSGATSGLNLLASTLTQAHVRSGDRVLVSMMEHHSNIVPWQLACERVGAMVVPIPLDKAGALSLEAYANLLDTKPKIVAFTHVSNATGIVNPVQKIAAMARDAGALSVIDGTQAVPHLEVNVAEIGVDFYVFSSHKAYGPNGVGVVYGHKALLDALPPYQGGGDMIRNVSFSGTTFADPPTRFEAGTPNISGVIGMGVALAYLRNLGSDARVHEKSVLNYAKTRLRELPQVSLVGDSEHQVGSVSFVIEGVHPHDVGTLLDKAGVAVRVGHHCTQPLMEHFGVPATVRASFGVYSTCDDVDRLCDAVNATVAFFR